MKQIPRDLVMLFLLFSPLAQAASAVASDQPDILDEIVVEGTGSALDSLRQQMIRLEDKFFERYNELNTDDDFDMFCAVEKAIGTNTSHRHCRLGYQVQELKREGQEYLEALKDMSGGAEVQPWGPPTPVIMKRQFKEYQQNMRDVVSRDPELVEMLRIRYELGKRYEATQRKVFGRKAPEAEATETPTPPAP